MIKKCCAEQMDIHRSTDRKKHNWILTIHFSIKFQAYVEDDNDIIIEDDIVKAMSFYGRIYGTTAVLIDVVDLFGKGSLRGGNSKSELEHGQHMNSAGRKIR